MARIEFTKMVASGNDFILIDRQKAALKGWNLASLARSLCSRKYGVGADGLLFLGESSKADLSMRIFNADGSQAQMCGNGARCAAFYKATGNRARKPKSISIQTKAGLINAFVGKTSVRLRLTDPRDLMTGIPLKLFGRKLKVDFINTGVPHAVIFVDALDKIDVAGIGRQVRYHRYFLPAGTNVDFVQPVSYDKILVRTYERGVEDETLACGTGSTASALIFARRYAKGASKISVRTKSGELLKVYFRQKDGGFCDVHLEGKAGIVFDGKLTVRKGGLL
jgi:diaminopimelate epimerase